MSGTKIAYGARSSYECREVHGIREVVRTPLNHTLCRWFVPGTVELKGTYPAENIDEHICDAARTSTGSTSDDVKLLDSLVSMEHTSPLEFAEFDFEIEAPLDTLIHFLRHRTGSFSMKSARYGQVLPAFYCPARIAMGKSSMNKQVPLEHREMPEIADRTKKLCMEAYDEYRAQLNDGVAYERASRVLPTCFMSRLRMKMDANNLMRMLKLRTAEDAQEDTRYIATQMVGWLVVKAPALHSAWRNHYAAAMKLSSDEIGAIRNGSSGSLSARRSAVLVDKTKRLGITL